jgi:phenylpropionate dioxygenase-like ring-hydroxylating dioxygenase large terminal subunit
MEALRSASREIPGTSWPRYNAAVLGFREYWYPVMFSRQLRQRPRAISLCGDRLVLGRRGGRVRALAARGPEAASRRVYPAEERAGLIWVYAGDQPPPPVEADVPTELLGPNMVIEGMTQLRKGNWRYAAENGIDEGHGRYLHRSALWTTFRKMPAWTEGTRLVPDEDGQWLIRMRGKAVWEDEYPGVGRWPPRYPWRNRRGNAALYHRLGIRLPSTLINEQDGWADFEIWVPWDADHHLAILLAVTEATGARALAFRAWYRLWVRWIFHGGFNGQDQWMIEQMAIPPERLYRPDVSITAWRKWCQERARGAPVATTSNDDWERAVAAEYAEAEAAATI